jgi:hypothetical protein
MDKETQKARILAYCQKHGSITIRDAAVKLEMNSPSKRISEMRRMDKYDVQQIREERIKDNGEVVRYNRYFITAVGADG